MLHKREKKENVYKWKETQQGEKRRRGLCMLSIHILQSWCKAQTKKWFLGVRFQIIERRHFTILRKESLVFTSIKRINKIYMDLCDEKSPRNWKRIWNDTGNVVNSFSRRCVLDSTELIPKSKPESCQIEILCLKQLYLVLII